MSSLINDVILRTGIIEKLAGEQGVKWFSGISTLDMIFTIILPLVISVIVAFTLKQRYDRWRTKQRHASRYEEYEYDESDYE